MSDRLCRACNVPLVFLEGPAGRSIPGQRVKTVYYRVGDRLMRIAVEGELYISHFETCPNASRFSRTAKR